MSDAGTAARPVGFAAYRERIGGLMNGAGIEKALAFRPDPTDVVLSPFAKCGTTWLQQVVHGLRTRGDMDFDDISRVVPWIETAPALGIDLDGPQRARPRAFKSHLPWDRVPKGARYIVSIRNPGDALVSMYRFMEGWFFEPGSVSISEFAQGQFLARGDGRDYWAHLVSWWSHRHDENVLLLAYEQMHRDLEATVRRVAAFIGVPLDDELLDLVVRQSSLEFMLAHKDRFDDRMMRDWSERAAGLPPGSDSAKVRTGSVGGHVRELPQEVSAELDRVWREEIEPRFGAPDYATLAAVLEPPTRGGATR